MRKTRKELETLRERSSAASKRIIAENGMKEKIKNIAALFPEGKTKKDLNLISNHLGTILGRKKLPIFDVVCSKVGIKTKKVRAKEALNRTQWLKQTLEKQSEKTRTTHASAPVRGRKQGQNIIRR